MQDHRGRHWKKYGGGKWGYGGLAPIGVQGQSPWSGGQAGEAERNLSKTGHFSPNFTTLCSEKNTHFCFLA